MPGTLAVLLWLFSRHSPAAGQVLCVCRSPPGVPVDDGAASEASLDAESSHPYDHVK